MKNRIVGYLEQERMSDMSRRLKKIEKALNVDKEEGRVAEIVLFCDGKLPPDQTHGNLTIRHVRYEDICERQEQQ